MGRQFDLLVPPFRGTEMAGDDPRAMHQVGNRRTKMRLVDIHPFAHFNRLQVTPPCTTPADEAHMFEPHFDRHVWIYRDNPNGVFAPFNPNVSCE